MVKTATLNVGTLTITGVGIIVFLAACFAQRLNAIFTIKKCPWLLGDGYIRVDKEFIRLGGDGAEALLRLSQILRVDYCDGDIYVFTSPLLASAVPKSAFQSVAEAQTIFKSIEQLRSAASAQSVTHDTVRPVEGTWPPAPAIHIAALPPAGPPMDTDDKVSLEYVLDAADYRNFGLLHWMPAMRNIGLGLVIALTLMWFAGMHEFVIATIQAQVLPLACMVIAFLAINWWAMSKQAKRPGSPIRQQSMATDFKAIRFEAPESSGYLPLTIIYNVRLTSRYILVYVTPRVSHIIPTRAFPSPGDAKAFGERLKSAVARSKNMR